MSPVEPFDPRTVPLEGLRLIEASAGTGKTFSLAGLYLRLVVEKGADVREILVMTFTRAATQELRERIRSRLATAARLAAEPDAADPDSPEHRFALEVIRGADGEEPPGRVARRLREAAARMDEATISTIHAFAQQAAAENAFDSSLPFDRGEQVDDGPLRDEAVADFWRAGVIGRPAREASAFLHLWPSPEALGKDLAPALERPRVPLAGPSDEEIAETTERARRLWREQGGELAELLRRAEAEGALLKDKPLDKARQANGDMETVLANVEAGLEGIAGGHAALPGWVADLGDDAGAEGLFKKKPRQDWCRPQDLEVARVIAELQPLGKLAALREARANVRGRVLERKRQRRQFSFSDMIEALDEALEAEGGAALAESLHRTWPFALVDEFQDTDPVQYDILRRIYRGRDTGGLLLIGDPKQAIFGFRGGDVFAYLEAMRDAEARYGLDTNFRSSRGLIEGVAALFRGPAAATDTGPFLIEGIDFHPVEAGRGEGERALERGGEPVPPVTVWRLDLESPNKEEALRRLREATVAEIRSLLDPGREARWRGRQGPEDPVRPGDIAVLVNTNREAGEMQQALSRRGIASVCLHQQSVFAAPESGEVLRALRAAATPADGDAVRAALATRLLGHRLGDLLALEEDEPAWQEAVGRFQAAHERWRTGGVLAMLEPFFQEVSPRLLALEDGERRMTNFLQLGELLSGAEAECFGMGGLIRWLDERILDPDDDAGEAEQLRLESDDDLVRIATVHKVKGLEYPVVLAPYAMFMGATPRDLQTPRVYHSDRGEARLDYGAAGGDAAERALRESLAEKVRLLYVALTRAQQACYLGWGPANTAQSSALAWLLHAGDGADPVAMASSRGKPPDWLSPENVGRRLDELAERSGGAVRIADPPAGLPAGERTEPLQPPTGSARDDLPAPRPEWSVFSFSRLVAGGAHHVPAAGAEDEAPDERLAEAPGEAVELRGPAFGTAVHDLLERVEPSAWPDPEQDPGEAELGLVASRLAIAGVALPEAGASRQRLLEAVAGMVSRCLHTPLPEIGPLAGLQAEGRLAEMEFFMGLGGPPAGDVVEHLAHHGYATRLGAERREQVLRGLMHGFIDLTVEAGGRFWVLDYKTNDLGDRREHYAPEALTGAVRDAHYDLQYLIYMVALHRHLARRLPDYAPDRHLGGVQYLFLRGMNGADASTGVFTDRPDPGLIEELDRLFAGAEPGP